MRESRFTGVKREGLSEQTEQNRDPRLIWVYAVNTRLPAPSAFDRRAHAGVKVGSGKAELIAIT